MANPIIKAGESALEQATKKFEEKNAGAVGEAITTSKQPSMLQTVTNKITDAALKPENIAGAMGSAGAISVGAAATVGNTTPIQNTDTPGDDPMANQIRDAFAEGYSKEEIASFLGEQMKGQMTPEQIKQKVQLIAEPNREGADTPAEVKAMDLADKYKNVYEKYSDSGKYLMAIASGDQATIHEVNKDRIELNKFIADELKGKHNVNAFVDPESGELMMQTEDGKQQPIDSSFINGLQDSGFELGGALAGASAGARIVGTAFAAAAPPVLPYVGPAAKPIAGAVGATAGALVGGAMGAFTGRGIDLLRNSMTIKEDLDAGFALQQMTEAGATDALLSVAGGTVLKLGKGAITGANGAWKLVTQGNTKGAFKALQETVGFTKEEAQQIVTDWEKLAQQPAPGKNLQEKAMAVVATTMPQAEGIARAAISEDPQASARMVRAIDDRAKSLAQAVDKSAPANIATTLQDSLGAYRKDVQDFYGMVKQEATDIVDHTDYRFDYEKIAINPVLEKIGATLDNPMVKERFVGMMSKIGRLSETRTFSDLVELRQTVNDFKYNTKITRYHDKVALDTALNKIDGEISKVAKEYMPNGGKAWLNNFKTAKTEYAKMLQLEENSLVKSLSKSGVTEADIRKVLPKYMTSVDSTFDNVMEKLPPAVRAKTEMAAVKYMTEKFTSGSATDLQAVHFPALAEQLKTLPLQTKEAKALASTVDQMAKVFKNDPSLAKLGGQFYVRGGGGTLTTDLVAKTKYAVAGAVWRHISKLAPTQYGRNASLITATSRLLENPMKAKTVSELMGNLTGDEATEMKSLVRDLQIQYTKQAEKAPPEKLKLYKVSSGDKLNASNGIMGRGVYMTERVSNPGVTEQGKNIVKYEINRSQLADIKKVSAIMGKDMTIADLRKVPDLEKKLSEQGFVGISHDGRVMLFNDSVIENGITRKDAKKWGDPTM